MMGWVFGTKRRKRKIPFLSATLHSRSNLRVVEQRQCLMDVCSVINVLNEVTQRLCL
jgi:hypothetical protein